MNDPSCGTLLQRFRDVRPTTPDFKKINTRVIGMEDEFDEGDIAKVIVYATKSNIDRTAINVSSTSCQDTSSLHSSDIPQHTIFIRLLM